MGIRSIYFNLGKPILEIYPVKTFKNRESAFQGQNIFEAMEIRTGKDQKQYKCPLVGLSELWRINWWGVQFITKS